MYNNYLRTFEGLLCANSFTQRRITDTEFTLLDQYLSDNPVATHFSENSTAHDLNLSNIERYISKVLVCSLVDCPMGFENYAELAQWCTEQLQPIYDLDTKEFRLISEVFDLSNLETFTSRFGDYLTRLSRETFNGRNTASKCHLKVLLITLLNVERQVARNYDDDNLAHFLFRSRYQEMRLDLDYLFGATDIISNQLHDYILQQGGT